MKIKVTFPILSGITVAIAIYLAFSMPEVPNYLFSSLGAFLSVTLPTTFGFLFGWFFGALAEETYWFNKDQSTITKNELLWGWAGVIIGFIVAYMQRTFSTPVGYSLLTAGVVTFILWGGFAFPLILKKARNSTTLEPSEQ